MYIIVHSIGIIWVSASKGQHQTNIYKKLQNILSFFVTRQSSVFSCNVKGLTDLTA